MIFGLQPLGGITNYAFEMAFRYSQHPEVALTMGWPHEIISKRRSQIEALGQASVTDRIPNRFGRYGKSPLRTPFVHSSYYRLSKRRNSINVVTAYDFVYERYRSGLAAFVHGVQKRHVCENADLILCISENTRNDLLDSYSTIGDDRVLVTHLGVDGSTFFEPKELCPDYANAVIFVGERNGYKRFDLAVNAVALSLQDLVIVGGSLSAKELELLEGALKGRWRFAGRLSDVELRTVYGSAYAFIYPSDYEGFGLPILEAQACGCPAVVANRSSFPEVGRDAAIYAAEQTPEAYADCLANLEVTETRDVTRKKGLANASSFHWDKTFDDTLAAIGKVTGK